MRASGQAPATRRSRRNALGDIPLQPPAPPSDEERIAQDRELYDLFGEENDDHPCRHHVRNFGLVQISQIHAQHQPGQLWRGRELLFGAGEVARLLLLDHKDAVSRLLLTLASEWFRPATSEKWPHQRRD